MLLPPFSESVVWYGPATATFFVQFGGDPFDAAKNDVRVRFIGDRSQREERIAYFDPSLGTWKASLYAKSDGNYRAVLIRNGQEALAEPQEGILELHRSENAGIVLAKSSRPDRLVTDGGEPWTGVGADLGASPSREAVAALAKAGATWVRAVAPVNLWDGAGAEAFSAAMDEIERRGLGYTLVVPKESSAAWRRYALARFGASPRLVGWENGDGISDPWDRATTPTAVPWPGLFENRPGPFLVDAGDPTRIKALETLLRTSEWIGWQSPRAWQGEGAKGVVESDRLILMASPGAKLTGVPLADGDYDLTTIDPASGTSTVSRIRVEHAMLALDAPGERFYVLRRRL